MYVLPITSHDRTGLFGSVAILRGDYIYSVPFELTPLISGRRKKKKCDLAKPECVRCRKSTGSVVCEWPAHASSEDGGRYHPRLDVDARRDPIQMSMESGSPSQTTMVLHDSRRKSNNGTLPRNTWEHGWEAPSPQNSIENCITISLPAGVNKVSP